MNDGRIAALLASGCAMRRNAMADFSRHYVANRHFNVVGFQILREVTTLNHALQRTSRLLLQTACSQPLNSKGRGAVGVGSGTDFSHVFTADRLKQTNLPWTIRIEINFSICVALLELGSEIIFKLLHLRGARTW